MTLGSLTTVLAFLALQFANASMLRDIGYFAGFNLVGAALCSLIFLPHFISSNYFGSKSDKTWSVPPILVGNRFSRYLIPIVFVLTPVMLYFANQVQFNSDMNKLNFMTPDLKETESTLNSLTGFARKSVFVVSDGESMEQALRENEKQLRTIESLKQSGVISRFSSVSSFLISDSLQQARISRWNSFWSEDKRAVSLKTFSEESEKIGFSTRASVQFDSLINRKYAPLTHDEFGLLRKISSMTT